LKVLLQLLRHGATIGPHSTPSILIFPLEKEETLKNWNPLDSIFLLSSKSDTVKRYYAKIVTSAVEKGKVSLAFLERGVIIDSI